VSSGAVENFVIKKKEKKIDPFVITEIARLNEGPIFRFLKGKFPKEQNFRTDRHFLLQRVELLRFDRDIFSAWAFALVFSSSDGVGE